MPLHDDTIPSNPLRPPFFFHDSVLRNALRARNGNDAGKARARRGREGTRGVSLALITEHQQRQVVPLRRAGREKR